MCGLNLQVNPKNVKFRNSENFSPFSGKLIFKPQSLQKISPKLNFPIEKLFFPLNGINWIFKRKICRFRQRFRQCEQIYRKWNFKRKKKIEFSFMRSLFSPSCIVILLQYRMNYYFLWCFRKNFRHFFNAHFFWNLIFKRKKTFFVN